MKTQPTPITLDRAINIANKYIRKNKIPCMNIGGGPCQMRNWLHVGLGVKDNICWDLKDGLPFCNDNTFNYIYS